MYTPLTKIRKSGVLIDESRDCNVCFKVGRLLQKSGTLGKLCVCDMKMLYVVYRQDCLVFHHPSPWCRLLVHKVSAFYGLEHNVDSTKMNVTVSRTKITRM